MQEKLKDLTFNYIQHDYELVAIPEFSDLESLADSKQWKGPGLSIQASVTFSLDG